MIQLGVADLDRWWQHIESLELDKRFGVGPPRPPKEESWGLRVAYRWDPAGVLWHITAAGHAKPAGAARASQNGTATLPLLLARASALHTSRASDALPSHPHAVPPEPIP